MALMGYFLFSVLIICGMGFGQYIFWRKTGRTFWRGILPYDLRKTLAPADAVRLDPWMYFEEWTAILMVGAFLTLPVIALDLMGFLKIFS